MQALERLRKSGVLKKINPFPTKEDIAAFRRELEKNTNPAKLERKSRAAWFQARHTILD